MLTQDKVIRSAISEDKIRKHLMNLPKRDVVEMYLQLRFDKTNKKEKK